MCCWNVCTRTIGVRAIKTAHYGARPVVFKHPCLTNSDRQRMWVLVDTTARANVLYRATVNYIYCTKRLLIILNIWHTYIYLGSCIITLPTRYVSPTASAHCIGFGTTDRTLCISQGLIYDGIGKPVEWAPYKNVWVSGRSVGPVSTYPPRSQDQG